MNVRLRSPAAAMARMRQGVMASTMVAICGALVSKREVFRPFLELILRDDIISWHVSKSSVTRTEEQQKQVIEGHQATTVNPAETQVSPLQRVECG